MSLVPVHSTVNLQEKGQQVVTNNRRMADFANMLSHPEFAAFFDKYFDTWENAKDSIMLLKTGSAIRDSLREYKQDDVSGLEIAAVLDHVIKQPELRRKMVLKTLEFME